jgi:hypothetical protein
MNERWEGNISEQEEWAKINTERKLIDVKWERLFRKITELLQHR